MLYIPWMIILGDCNIKKISFQNFDFSAVLKNCTSRLCTGPFTRVSHYWWKQSFRVFGTGVDRPSAGL